jgi:hypothetical protein
MAGDIKLQYVASQAVSVTNLHSLASDNDAYLAGWTSNSVNNTSNEYLDYMYSGTFTTHASNKDTTGEIRVYVIAALNDTPTWPATASGTIGTEGALSFTDTEERDSLCRLLAVLTSDSTTSQILAFPPTGIAQLFGGFVPPYHAIFVTQNVSTTTTAGLAAAGSALYYTPVNAQYT